jgi:sorting nexin-1/2
VPPLPDKQRGASLFDGAFIEERRFHLEVFLRRAVLNPELSGAECLLVFLGGSDVEFRRALRDGGSFGGSSRGGSSNSNVDADDCNGHASDGAEAYCHDPQDHSPLQAGALLAGGTVEKLTTKKAAGIKKWIKEKKTIMQCAMVRSPDDVVFERANHYVAALEAGLVRIEAQASRMVKGEKELSSCMLEFGLGCDALAHVDDEICQIAGSGSGTGGEPSRSSGIGRTFRLIGRSADGASAVASAHHERGSGRFHEPLRDHLRVVQAVKVALSKRNNRLVTYSTCLNAVDSKRASLHKYRITLDHQKAMGAEASLGRAEAAAISARANYEEVSARVLREVDRFRREYAVAMYATMAEFARAQKEHYEGMNEVWASLLPQVESLDASACNGSSFAREAAALREGKSGGGGGLGWGGGDVAHLDGMPMPMYPPPPEPTSNGTHNGNVMESSMLSGAIRYRDASPEE